VSIILDHASAGFVLRRIDASGTPAEITLSDEDVLSLAQSAQLLRDRILSKLTPEGGAVSAAYSTPVAQIGLAPDVLGENILLTMVAPSGAQVTFSLPPHIAQILAERVPVHLAKAKAATLRTRQ
jgi:hypothetical protein